jgi:hypothetical protein
VSLPLRNWQRKHVTANSEIGRDDGVIYGFFLFLQKDINEGITELL